MYETNKNVRTRLFFRSSLSTLVPRARRRERTAHTRVHVFACRRRRDDFSVCEKSVHIKDAFSRSKCDFYIFR